MPSYPSCHPGHACETSAPNQRGGWLHPERPLLPALCSQCTSMGSELRKKAILENALGSLLPSPIRGLRVGVIFFCHHPISWQRFNKQMEGLVPIVAILFFFLRRKRGYFCGTRSGALCSLLLLLLFFPFVFFFSPGSFVLPLPTSILNSAAFY